MRWFQRFDFGSGARVSAPRCAQALAALALISWLSLTAPAQSGRRSPQPRSPVPASTPTPPSTTTTGSSESGAKVGRTTGGADKTALYTFIVFEEENMMMSMSLQSSRAVMQGFMQRMGESPLVKVSAGGRSGRKSARDRAKAELTAHVVLLQLDEESPGRGTTPGTVDLNNLVVRYMVYQPETATLKHQGSIMLRPYQPTARVGGIRIPIPAPRVNHIDYLLEQAGRDAAERIMSAFSIRIPSN